MFLVFAEREIHVQKFVGSTTRERISTKNEIINNLSFVLFTREFIAVKSLFLYERIENRGHRDQRHPI